VSLAMPLLKRDLVARLQESRPDHVKKDLETVVRIIFETMAAALREGRRVEIRGLGSFSVHRQRGREFVNPKTGAATRCSANNRVCFRAGKSLNSSAGGG